MAGAWFSVSARGRGRRRATSTSKIRKMTANKKNRREKGLRAEFFGSKPHSKGVAVSRVIEVRIANRFAMMARRRGRAIAVEAMRAK